MSLWNDVKKNLGDLYSVTSEKSTEIARITSRRYDKFGIRREIERQFGELGNFVYQGLKEGREDLLADPVAKQLIERIERLETELLVKDEEIETIRREAAEKQEAEQEAEQAGAAGGSGSGADAYGDFGGETAPEADEGPGAVRRNDAAATVLKGPVLHEGSDESAILVEPTDADEDVAADADEDVSEEKS